MAGVAKSPVEQVDEPGEQHSDSQGESPGEQAQKLDKQPGGCKFSHIADTTQALCRHAGTLALGPQAVKCGKRRVICLRWLHPIANFTAQLMPGACAVTAKGCAGKVDGPVFAASWLTLGFTLEPVRGFGYS